VPMLASFLNKVLTEEPHSERRKPYLSSPKPLAITSFLVEISEESQKNAVILPA